MVATKKVATKKIKLTHSTIKELPVATRGQYVVRDSEVKGLYLKVGTATKTFMLRREVPDSKAVRGMRTVHQTIGRWTGMDGGVTREAAEKEAYAILSKSELKTVDGGLTVADAVRLFEASNAKGRPGQPRAEKTQRRYAQIVDGGYLAAWMDRPLRSITRIEAYDRHQALAKEVRAGKYARAKAKRSTPERQTGQTTADDVMRYFRSVWNRAMRADETLPASPTINVEWFNVKAERTAIPSASLAKWYQGVKAIPNPIRRDYLWFVLWSGLRRESAASVRWADVDWKGKLLHIPKPKGGERRAFDLPLSDFLIALLKERQRDNPELVKQKFIPDDADEWVFPAFGKTGHIAEPRAEVDGVPFTIHDLRRTFVTVAESLDLSPFVIGALVNHRQPEGSVTAGYVKMETERLRPAMEAIGARLKQLCGAV